MNPERVMLLIDADNVSIDVMEQAVRLVHKQHGGLHVRRAYCTAESAVKHQTAFKRLGIKPMVNLAAGKNSTDIALAVDAIDLVLAERPDVVVIASSDSDFAPLVQRLREKGCVVRGIGQHGKTGEETQDVYDDYTVLEHRRPAAPGEAPAPARKTAARKAAAKKTPAVAKTAVKPAPKSVAAAAKKTVRKSAKPPAEAAVPAAQPATAPTPDPAPLAARLPAPEAVAAVEPAPDAEVVETAAPAPAARKSAVKAVGAAKKPRKTAARKTADAGAAPKGAADEPAATAREAHVAAPAPAAPQPASEPRPVAAPVLTTVPVPAAAAAAPQQRDRAPAPGTASAAAVFDCLPELAAGQTLAINVAVQRLREARLLGKNASSSKLFAQIADRVELLPADKPTQLRRRA